MRIKIRTVDLGDKKSYAEIIHRAREDISAVIPRVIPILEKVCQDGDRAVLEYTKKWDQVAPEKWVWSPFEIDTSTIPQKLQEGFQIAYENITEFHKAQLLESWEKDISGNKLGIKYVAIDSVTVYAPGGTALYPSSILMGVIPAKIAGTRNIQIATPPQKDGIPPILAYVARLVGVDRIVTVGGAQGIAACAYGTETIPPSDCIVGPGNSYVTAAKVYLAGQGVIRIDSPAGPSDVMIVADESANPEWIACDLLSQAEHGKDSVAILATPSMDLIERTSLEIEKAFRLRTKRLEIKQAAILNNSYLLNLKTIEDCLEFANIFCPEHLEILTRDPRKHFQAIRNAGSVFLGEYSPVAMGDYITGTNHILPTAGGSKIYSSLGVENFLKRITYQEVSKDSLIRLYPYVKAMSEAEGLDEEHGHSVFLRTQEIP